MQLDGFTFLCFMSVKIISCAFFLIYYKRISVKIMEHKDEMETRAAADRRRECLFFIKENSCGLSETPQSINLTLLCKSLDILIGIWGGKHKRGKSSVALGLNWRPRPLAMTPTSKQI